MTPGYMLATAGVTLVLMLAALAIHHAPDAPDEERRTDHDMRQYVEVCKDQLRMRILSPKQVDNYMQLRRVPSDVRSRILANAGANQ